MADICDQQTCVNQGEGENVTVTAWLGDSGTSGSRNTLQPNEHGEL